jgi:protein-S-isoprenylcysteine O-methyltransferase Ste14
MFFLAGIGVLRVVWLPLLDLSPKVLRLGEIVCLPSWLLFGSLLVPVSCIIMVLGLMVFTLGVFTWLYSKFKGLGIVDFWIYEYSRHPQYLGFLIWSYGLILLTSCINIPRGGCIPPPSFPWLISALAIVGIALHEELTMVKKYGDKYKKYMDKTPFMLPLPKKLSTIITAPVRIVTKKNLPESNKQIIAVLSTYLCILVLLSLPLQYFIKL